MAADLPPDPFGRARKPATFDREGRVRLVGEVFEALLRGEMPSPEAARFVGSAGAAWFAQGGDLLRDHLRITGPRASTMTAPKLWQRMLAEGSSGRATDEEDDAILPDIAQRAEP